jgi:hypothetical protein
MRAALRQHQRQDPMRLVDTQTVDGDVAFLTYDRVQDA